MGFGGMQMPPVIVPMPGGADPIGLFQDEARATGSSQASPDRQPRRPGTDDNRLALNHAVKTGHFGRRALCSETVGIPLCD